MERRNLDCQRTGSSVPRVKPKAEPPIVLIDTREQLPLPLPNSRVATLKVGDYSLEGLTEVVAVERKSLPDLYMCVGRERERFERELEKLAKFPYPAIILECSFEDVLAGFGRSEVHPHSAAGSIIAWSTRYRIPIWPAGNRRNAAGIVYKILLKAAEEYANKPS
jgi:DNA excision repair protein ERCC-4